MFRLTDTVTVIITPKHYNRLAFLIKKLCVFFEAGTAALNINQISFLLQIPVLRFSPVSTIPPLLHTHSFILILLLSEGQAGKAWELSNKGMPFQAARKVPNSNLSRCIDSPDCFVSWFYSACPCKSPYGTSKIRPFPSTPFPTHYSRIILPADPISADILSLCLLTPQINKCAFQMHSTNRAANKHSTTAAL